MKILFLAAAAALFVAAPASAAPQTFYFDCGGASPLTNLTPPPATWSATAPATALQAGGGCLTVDPWIAGTAPGNTDYDTVVGGTYAGEVKQLELTLYGAFSSPVGRQLGVAPTAAISIDVGGTVVYAEPKLASSWEAAGSLPGGFKATWTIPDLEIPATDAAKQFTITVANTYTDDPIVFARGASDAASGITFYAQEDLPDPEPEEEG